MCVPRSIFFPPPPPCPFLPRSCAALCSRLALLLPDPLPCALSPASVSPRPVLVLSRLSAVAHTTSNSLQDTRNDPSRARHNRLSRRTSPDSIFHVTITDFYKKIVVVKAKNKVEAEEKACAGDIIDTIGDGGGQECEVEEVNGVRSITAQTRAQSSSTF